MRMRIGIINLSTLAALLLAPTLWGQNDTVYLINPSFEDFPRSGHAPRGWADCGFPGETPPDTQPDATFSVNVPALDGNTYLGMVVRDNDTWESVGQRLGKPLEKGKCYEFRIHLARSPTYVSVSRLPDSGGDPANYTTPAKLRVYGGNDFCDKAYLLAETKLIINHRWLEYRMKFEPVQSYTHIVFEAFYNTPTLFPYNGNILLDKASAIVPIPCDEPLPEDPPAVAETTPKKPAAPKPAPAKPTTNGTSQAAVKSPPPAPAPPKPAEETAIAGVKRSEMRAGQTIRLDQLYFQADSTGITSKSAPVLDEIYKFLLQNPDVVVEIGGHTNNRPDHSYADKLSAARAKSVADYLVQKGISRERLQHKGYGKRSPVDRSGTPKGQQKNQRVEVKILSMEGSK